MEPVTSKISHSIFIHCQHQTNLNIISALLTQLPSVSVNISFIHFILSLITLKETSNGRSIF